MSIIAVSDMHFGHEFDNKPKFKEFLDHLKEKKHERDVKHLVLCGDFLDLWRRDLVGITIAYRDIINQLKDLQSSADVTVHIVAGNHDYHFMKLNRDDYEFCFYREEDNWWIRQKTKKRAVGRPIDICKQNGLVFESNSKKFRFVHGDQFELAQVVGRGLFEPLSYTSDETGETVSNIWDLLTGGWPFGGRKDGTGQSWGLKKLTKYRKKLISDPLTRINKILFEKTARKFKERHYKDEFLIFGHSHYPYLDEAGKLANCGTWVRYPEDPDRVVNTFIEVFNGKPKLMEFVGKDSKPPCEDIGSDKRVTPPDVSISLDRVKKWWDQNITHKLLKKIHPEFY